ncbi:hypothetical protein [Acidovorax sp. A1169]|uniref:hypothetical protein n=1 Tax=Acidovorax sp. A1169 TaxID=3059524 RepID=UPI002737BE0F|nr:hypothetical protein [Acidovorax sp. A1169]MDP4073922.1 hypothetical protein [Acidovorax sp. A1169]
MTCSVKSSDRAEYVQILILEYFRKIEGPGVVVTLDTFLGKHGLGHSMIRRKGYRDGIAEILSVRGCSMRTLRPTDFVDGKLPTVGHIAALVLKDLA